SQSVLASNWQEATPEEKRQFVEFFSQYLEDTYRTKIESYTDQSVEYLGEHIRKDRATVDTEIVTTSTRIPVTYRLKNNDGEWFAYDVIIEGVSLVNNYRNTFNAIIKAEGMSGLLLDLEGRIDDYKAKHGGLPPE
ncbi:MAG: ABC transporter substrate-binding protein, partial [Gammaproteobacteria bacterium]